MRAVAPDARVTVLMFKDGLLSKMAHDLRIAVERFEIDWGGTVSASFDPTSLRVLSPMQGGRDAPGLLSPRDLLTIEKTIQDEVLETRRFKSIRFTGTMTANGDRRTVVGTLSLHAVDKPLRFDLWKRDGRWEGRVEIDQRDFGITPYKAMLGTLRVQPRVIVELSLPVLP